MAWAPDWLIAIIRSRLVTRGILEDSYFPIEKLQYSSVWIDSNTSWQVLMRWVHPPFRLTSLQKSYSYSHLYGVKKRRIKPTLLCARQGNHSDAKRSQDEMQSGKFHLGFISALFGVWSDTRIWTPDGELPIPVRRAVALACIANCHLRLRLDRWFSSLDQKRTQARLIIRVTEGCTYIFLARIARIFFLLKTKMIEIFWFDNCLTTQHRRQTRLRSNLLWCIT